MIGDSALSPIGGSTSATWAFWWDCARGIFPPREYRVLSRTPFITICRCKCLIVTSSWAHPQTTVSLFRWCESFGTSQPALNCADITACNCHAGIFIYPSSSRLWLYRRETAVVLTLGWLLLLLTCVRSLVRYAWYPIPAARLSESAGSRVGGLD